MKTDLVYVLGSGSIWNNNELRFSLRSVQKNLKDVGQIYVVGENPGFLSSHIKYIYHPDPLLNNADGNMALKILRACNEKNLSDNFLFMNDDFIINQPINASKIPWLNKGNMEGRSEQFWTAQFYRYRLHRTFQVLKERGLPTIQYDYHAPMLLNKHWFPKVMSEFDFTSDIGYTFRSLYGNYRNLQSIPVLNHKVTIYKYYKFEELKTRTSGIPFIGFNDQGFNDSFKWWLADSFRNQSVFETDKPQDRLLDLYDWQKLGQPYWLGVSIFKQYFKNLNLISLFDKIETDHLKAKLAYKLMQTIKDI